MSESYTREIKSLDQAIKQLNDKARKLRLQKKEAQGHLYQYMVKNGLDNCDKITLKSVTPRPATKRKPEKAKKRDAIELFRIQGIENPEQFYAQFRSTQIYTEDRPETE